jgi:hypothetical protein
MYQRLGYVVEEEYFLSWLSRLLDIVKKPGLLTAADMCQVKDNCLQNAMNEYLFVSLIRPLYPSPERLYHVK